MEAAIHRTTDYIHSCLQINDVLREFTLNIPKELMEIAFEKALNKEYFKSMGEDERFSDLVREMRDSPNGIGPYFQKINMKALNVSKKLERIYKSRMIQRARCERLGKTSKMAGRRIKRQSRMQKIQRVEEPMVENQMESIINIRNDDEN